MTPGIYELILKAPDGRERRTLAWLPTAEVKQDYMDKAANHGLTVEIINAEGETPPRLV